MNPIEVRNIKIGEGIPKICLPIVGHTQYEITSQAMTIAALKPDIVEFRADWYDECTNKENLIEMLMLIRKLIDKTPLLFSFRTVVEGGIQELQKADYIRLNKTAVESGLVDMVDIELMIGDEDVKDLIKTAHENNVVVVLSNHDFEKTPEKEVLISRMEKMIELGADIPKVAVMPNNNRDVLTLLDVTDTFHTSHTNYPIITMAMDGRGVVSRIAGEIFGSSITFGCARKASAPGQIEAGELSLALRILHSNLYHKEI
ncbi:MAG: type I 3-dehydroquinate dehydratase [Clostridia bacterium]|nr:type I 3-dehydroquinate dehydratase [Clostridia bacterium]